MASTEIRERVERFTSLQAAQRALCHSVHPSELESVRGDSRALLILLQSYTAQSQSGRDESGSSSSVSLEDIDRSLHEQCARTLEVLMRIGLTQLRSTMPALAEQHPEDVCGLVDLLLLGDLDSEETLRMLDYLITILSTRDRNGQRVLCREPSSVTSRLSAATAERLRSATADCLLAEKILEESTARALQGGDIGEVRDRVRRCKDEVGRDLLHPRVLAAAVAYNVAMWNEVAIEIESSRSIDQLTEDLLIGQAEAGQVSPAAAAVQDLSSTGAFADLVEAFAARVAGQPPGDDPAGRVVACLDMKALRVEDADLFVGDDPEPPGDEKGAGEASRLMRSAVVLGLLLGQREEVAPGLEELGLDPELLATSGIEDLAHRMSELARRSFSDSGYSDAFRLSDVKTHSLAAHRKSRPSGGDGLTGASPPASSERSGSSIKLAQMIRDLPPWPVLFAGLLLLGVFSVPTIVSHGVKMDGSSSEFAAISPYIERGRHVGEGEARVFVGRVGDSWSYLDTESRREIVNGIGERLAREDVGRVVLEGARRQIVAEYEDGRIRYLVNRAPGQSLSP